MSAQGGKGVTYKGLKELIAFNKSLSTFLTQATNEAFKTYGKSMNSATQSRVPVRTGRLKRSGGFQVGNLFLSLFYDAPYARYVDLGTSRFAGRQYFFQVMEGHRPKMIGEINKRVGTMIKSKLGGSAK